MVAVAGGLHLLQFSHLSSWCRHKQLQQLQQQPQQQQDQQLKQQREQQLEQQQRQRVQSATRLRDGPYKRRAEYKIPPGNIIAKPVLPNKRSKITVEHIEECFLGPACQIPPFYFKPTYTTMCTMAEIVLLRLTLACARAGSTNSFRALNPLDKLGMAKDIEDYLYDEMDKMPARLCQENWLAMFLLYKVFAKYFNNSSQPTNNNRSVRSELHGYSEREASPSQSTGFLEEDMPMNLLDVYHDASTPSSSSISATSSRLDQQPIFSIPSAPTTLSPAIPSTTSTAIATTPSSSSSKQPDPPALDPIIPMQDNRYPKRVTINQPSPSPSSTTSSKRRKGKSRPIITPNRR
ncbi:hypothetical protein BDA99DRAFT_607057 [Phascolomyces articulosus]|uniref:Uncharacterized protein n=1 Tax=Phascolomyces articulosus TaxID=60185 RepID=A0AAD5PBG0_9FUNG|nr:hypothetical protein BDA99DRAFT_607057 [Phascolomyces articulosus]